MYTHAHTHTHTRTRTRTRTRARTRTYTYIFTRTHVHVHARTLTLTRTYMYILICTCTCASSAQAGVPVLTGACRNACAHTQLWRTCFPGTVRAPFRCKGGNGRLRTAHCATQRETSRRLSLSLFLYICLSPSILMFFSPFLSSLSLSIPLSCFLSLISSLSYFVVSLSPISLSLPLSHSISPCNRQPNPNLGPLAPGQVCRCVRTCVGRMGVRECEGAGLWKMCELESGSV